MIAKNKSSRPAGAPALGLIVVLCLAAVSLPGCKDEELGYLLEQAPGQFALLMDRVPFDKVLADPELDPEVRRKLEFVLDVKKYGVEDLGLIPNKNYEVFVELDREAVVWNLTAAERLSLTPLTWKFPVVGEVPYLGFFKKDDALAKERALEDEGYDVYVRTAGAYSMLGIVADPLYSPLLRYREADLANLVLHESLHGTVFIKGEMEFNENLALFVGNQGAYNYLAGRYGEDSEEAAYAVGSNIDAVTFSKELMAFYKEMEEMYGRDISDAEKERLKEEMIAEHKRHFEEEVLPSMRTGRYKSWPGKEINNATIISRAVYYHDLSLYEELYAAKNQDLRSVVDFFKEVQASGGAEPEKRARDWLDSCGGGPERARRSSAYRRDR